MSTTGTPDRVVVTVDGADAATLVPPQDTAALDLSALTEGAHTVGARAERGTQQVLATTVDVTVDLTAPQVLTTALDQAPVDAPLQLAMDSAPQLGGAQALLTLSDGVSRTVALSYADGALQLTISPEPGANTAGNVVVSGLADDVGNLTPTVDVPLIFPPWQRWPVAGATATKVAHRDGVGTFVAAVGDGNAQAYAVTPHGPAPWDMPVATMATQLWGLAVDSNNQLLMALPDAGGVAVHLSDGSGWTPVNAMVGGQVQAASLFNGADGRVWLVAVDGTGAVAVRSWNAGAFEGSTTFNLPDAADPAAASWVADGAGLVGAWVGVGESTLHVARVNEPGLDAVAAVMDVAAQPGLQWSNPRPAVDGAGELRVVASEGTAGSMWVRVFADVAGQPVEVGGGLNLDGLMDAPAAALVPSVGGWTAAWMERTIDGAAWRVAQHNGTGWAYHGPPTVVVDGSGLPAVAPALGRWGSLEAGTVVAVSYGNQALLSRFNGAQRAPAALPTPPAASGCGIPEDPSDPMFPQRILQTGCYVGQPVPQPLAAAVPYSVQSPLWSDAADKRRFLLLPGGTQVGYTAPGVLDLPVGTLTIKEFYARMDPADPASAVRIETRFLIKRTASIWDGYSFAWRADGSDADMVAADGATATYPRPQGAPVEWGFPSRNQCLTCHTTATGRALGLQAAQLNLDHDFGDATENQLQAWMRAGIMANADISAAPTLTHPHNPRADVSARTRAYLHANCSHCHLAGGPNPQWDARWHVPLATSQMCGGGRVVPGNPDASTLTTRMGLVTSMGMENPMPPLGRNVVDAQGLALVRSWVAGLTTCP